MQYYDMHTHILPDFDDGAKTVDDSLELIEKLQRQNVNNICLTPHFYTNELSIVDFASKRREAYEKFLPHKPKTVNIVLGAEVYVTKFLFSNDDLTPVTYGKSNYILTEFSYESGFTGKSMNQLLTLIENYNLIPVIPHVERYGALLNDASLLRELRDMGVLIQTNAVSFTKSSSYFKKRKLLKLIDKGMIDILGTDTHSTTHNSPDNFTQAIKFISEKCGKTAVRNMMSNAEKIFISALG